jgi:trk system potassium uptake protein
VDLGATILTATVCLGFETRRSGPKPSARHAKILGQLGVHHIVRPEHDMGKRVAHLVAGRMMDLHGVRGRLCDGEDDAAVCHSRSTPCGSPEVRKRFGVTIVAIKRPGEDFTYATQETVVNRGT